MSKQLLNDNVMRKSIKIRTSKSDIVLRYLLFSIAKNIGPNTHTIVRFFCPHNISESDCMVLDELLTTDIFSDSQIEKAASITLTTGEISYLNFQSILFWL
jgi:hypothetical protein